MSCVCILTPVVIAAWPAFSAAVVSAATSLGYQIVADQVEQHRQSTVAPLTPRTVTLEIPQSEVVTDQIGRDQRIRVERNGVTVTFSRDPRGQASVCVSGAGRTDETLRALGQEISQRVVQRYVYQRLIEEMQARQFTVVEEQIDEAHAIRLKVRCWENP
jgi:hypothetical protein